MHAPRTTSTTEKPTATVWSASTRRRSSGETCSGDRSTNPSPRKRSKRRLNRSEQDGAERGPRRLHPDRREHAAQDLHALVGVSGGEQLPRRGPLEIDALERRSAGGGLQVGAGRFGAATRSLKRPRQLNPDRPRLVVRARVRLEGQPVEAGCLVERQLARGLLGRAFGERRAALARPAPEQVNGERLQVHAGRGLERPRESPVMGAQVAGRELLDDGLPDAVVTGLDDLVALAEPDADEALAREAARRRRPTRRPRRTRRRRRRGGGAVRRPPPPRRDGGLPRAAARADRRRSPRASGARASRRSPTPAFGCCVRAPRRERGCPSLRARRRAPSARAALVGRADPRQREPLGVLERRAGRRATSRTSAPSRASARSSRAGRGSWRPPPRDTSRGGGPAARCGGRITSWSSATLSTSPHCTSSM